MVNLGQTLELTVLSRQLTGVSWWIYQQCKKCVLTTSLCPLILNVLLLVITNRNLHQTVQNRILQIFTSQNKKELILYSVIVAIKYNNLPLGDQSPIQVSYSSGWLVGSSCSDHISKVNELVSPLPQLGSCQDFLIFFCVCILKSDTVVAVFIMPRELLFNSFVMSSSSARGKFRFYFCEYSGLFLLCALKFLKLGQQ